MSNSSISGIDLFQIQKKKSLFILDVRTVTEYLEGHLWNSLHKPIDTLPSSISDIPKEALIITVCNKGGGRSESAANLLREAGWKNTKWLEGGYLGWIESGYPDYEPGFESS